MKYMLSKDETAAVLPSDIVLSFSSSISKHVINFWQENSFLENQLENKLGGPFLS